MIWDYRKWKKGVSILAIEKWKRENPFSKYLDIKSSEQIELDGIGCIDIGQIIRRYRLIYHAMQQGKKYGSNYNLTDEEIKQLTELGMIWDREQFKKNEDVVVDDKLNNPYYKKQVFDDLDYMASVIRIKHSLTKEEFSEVLEDYVENFMADDKDNHTKNDTNKMLIMKK